MSRRLMLMLVLGAPAGCNGILGIRDIHLETQEANGTVAASEPDGGAADPAEMEQAQRAPPNAPPPTCPFDADGFGDIRAPGCWEMVDVAKFASGKTLGGTDGIAFDGRYMYFAPQSRAPMGDVLMRYDTTAPLDSSAAWSALDVLSKAGAFPFLSGAVFDGRFVTFGAGAASGQVMQFDTTLPFQLGGSWRTFNRFVYGIVASTLAARAYDGTYIYFVSNATVVRHDARAAMDASWEEFSLGQLPLGLAPTFKEIVFDGRFITLLPEGHGVVVRYDTSAPFTAATSWTNLNTELLRPGGLFINRGVFDGRYIFFSPATEKFATRYDTQQNFKDPASWTLFDVESLGFQGAQFETVTHDGRFVYLTPGRGIEGAVRLPLARYDTTKPFGAAPSWSVADLASFGAQVFGVPLSSSAYDGQYVYFAPCERPLLARFAARKARHPPTTQQSLR